MVNSKFFNEISDWLFKAQSVSVPDQKLIEDGATLLLRANRNRNMYNFIVKNWTSNVQFKRLVYELNKFSKIEASGVTLAQIEEMKPKVEAIGEEVAKITEVVENKEKKEEVKVEDVKVMIGKRSDHDSLPEKIKVLYNETYNILRKERSIHEKLKLMKNALPCDRHEYTLQLIELDKKRLEDWETYDSFVLDKVSANESANEIANENANVSFKEISTARSMISKKIDKLIMLKKDSTSLADYVVLRDKLQLYYNKIKESGSTVTDKVLDKLVEGGINV